MTWQQVALLGYCIGAFVTALIFALVMSLSNRKPRDEEWYVEVGGWMLVGVIWPVTWYLVLQSYETNRKDE